MPWVVGVDEAGYGPNLGPFVQSAVGVWLPEHDPAGWETFGRVVRRHHEASDGRLLVDDSKKVYSRGGLEALEQAAHLTLPPSASARSCEAIFRPLLSAPDWEMLVREPWYRPETLYPCETSVDAIAANGKLWSSCCQRPVVAFVHLVQASQINRLIDATNSKAAVLTQGLITLLERIQTMGAPGEPLLILCDKQGGRNYYAAMLQTVFAERWVYAEKESAEESRYRVDGPDCCIRMIFRPRAEQESLSVALASVLSKYLRELCMRQFNAFWAQHVPGLRPTAGYPVDARRFYDEIRDARLRLGIPEDAIWRKR